MADELSDVPESHDELPDSVRVTGRGDDAWYEYDGEALFSEGNVVRIWNAYQRMQAADWERVQGMRDGSTRKKIRTEDAEDAQADLEDAWEAEHEETPFVFSRDGLLGNHHGIKEEGPRKSVAWADYDTGRPAGLGGSTYKRQQLLQKLKEYEQWRFHTDVWLPVIEEYNEKYPY